ncbi:MAG: TonB-dependent receptor [Proteobacteria bacterium]|nr:TonB-dependent receptor [Pseudomonadota bacterium]
MNKIKRSGMQLKAGAILPVIACSLFASGQSMAQDADREIFEEIVVLAQKRAQNIMDVPVAVSAVSGTQMVEAGIKDMADLQQNVPNLIVSASQTATTSTFSIRGISSTSNNFGVDSSVGLYVDGVYRSRQSSMINDLIDVEAVEVLRGPQGTLFGKNTPAGAVQVRTVAPSHDRDAFVDVSVGDYDMIRVSAATNVSISDNLAMRATLFSSQREGYVDDYTLGDNLYNDRDRIGGRLQFLYEPSDDLNVRVIADYAEIDEICCAAVTLVDGIYSHGSLSGTPLPGSDAALLQFGGTVFTDFPYPQPFLDALAGLPGTIVTGVGVDDHIASMNFLPVSQNEDAGLSVDINKTLASGKTFTSITAYRTFDTYDSSDVDFSNVDLVTRINDAELDMLTQEFRFAGDFGDNNNFVVGVYYFAQTIDQSTDTIGTPFTQIYLNNNPDVVDVVDLVDGVAALAGPLYQPAGIAFLPNIWSNDMIEQDQDAWAVFGQVDFSLTENLVLTLGARYTDETKEIDAAFTQNTPPGPIPDFSAIALAGCQVTMCDPDVGPFNPFDPATFATFAPFFVDGWGAYAFPPLAPRTDLDDELKDDQTTGTAKLSWFVNDTSMIYASYSTGYKSGGTNTERIPAAFDSIFGPETSASFEIGYKGDIGPVRLGLTVYDTEFDDFQAQTFTGTGFNLQNAGSIDNTGVEVEMLIRPTDSFEAQIIYTHNEVQLAEFEAGTCWDAYTFHTGIPDPGLPSDFNAALDAEICSKTGQAQAYNPEDRFFVGLQQEFNVGADNTLFLRGEYSSNSATLTDGDLDPFTEQNDFEIVNARIGINFGKSNSSLTLWGRNVTDERYILGSSDAPIQVGRMHAYPAEPATYGVTYRKAFD